MAGEMNDPRFWHRLLGLLAAHPMIPIHECHEVSPMT
jgi:hypothetical protein